MSNEQLDSAIPTSEPQKWAFLADGEERYQLGFASRDAAVTALGGESGVVVRYERGFPREGLENLFDATLLLDRVEEYVGHGGRVLANFESGIFDTLLDEEDDLRRRLAEALWGWIKEVNPPCWVVVELEEVEVPTNAKNATP